MKYVTIAHAMVDDVFFDYLNGFIWTLSAGYARGTVDGKRVHLHSLVHRLVYPSQYPCKKGMEIDHEDRNRLNNQAINLRLVTRSANHANSGLRKTNKSGYTGVSWVKARKLWKAHIQVNRKVIALGHFTDPVEAAKKVNDAYRYYYPAVAVPNSQI
jgi:hypothetical protein